MIGVHGADVSVGIQLLSGETLLQLKRSTGHRWGSNPGPSDSMTIAVSAINHVLKITVPTNPTI